MKNVLSLAAVILIVAGLGAAFSSRREAERLRVEKEALAAELEAVRTQTKGTLDAKLQQRDREIQSLRSEAAEVPRLRNEVSQLRTAAKESAQLNAEQQRLLAASKAAAPAANPPSTNQFPRANWAFSGYRTPEAALVSAIAAMRDGNPQAYLDSLSPEEQKRMATQWLNKSETDVAAKHQSDVSTITGMRVLDRTTISPEEVQMNVYLEGVGRVEKVGMKLVNGDWKFGGFIRNPK